MNINLKQSYGFTSIVNVTGIPSVNFYNVEVNFLTNTTDAFDHNIAYDRANWVMEQFNNTVIVDNEDIAKVYEELGHKVLLTPEPPVDHFLGVLLIHKLNAVMEERMLAEHLTINSYLGKELTYSVEPTDINDSLEEQGWWNDPNPVIKDTAGKQDKNVRVIDFKNKKANWNELDLGWNTEEHSGYVELETDE